MYVIIPQAFAEANQYHQIGENVFNYGVTRDGRIVCSANSLQEFPELFAELGEDWQPQYVELTLADFYKD